MDAHDEGGEQSPQAPQLPSPARLAELRRRYGRGELVEGALPADPLALFHTWLADALAEKVPEPNAMVVATVGPDGIPSARTVLLKGLDERGFVFYTNYGSAKAADLDAHPNAALVFPWHAMERQVRVTGPAARVSREESAAYFASRPLESRLGAWASPQSRVVADRESLDRVYAETAERFAGTEDVPLPDFWGGYRVRPEVVEFWQGRQGRMHDRVRFRRTEEKRENQGDWIVERLAP
ncbi:pyridoxamine 5'-phosphate oxidase [Actinopolymorpha cephalotaxi]|uniref:Pyridoxine/pyridoxamine 5'-phosphate oxidase n=1 Tax=Actinopolymorpha cephalotaxi TaxID=504797 RepID=A0A1I3B6S0_9ACTN|nr:pyridoxamine 5'-phosphate oxidase [Actinopolymorpha cephalotaxi]NYH81281.1 pyridoxamine 5'-phosphate oxidase [Actinopolymorpha cephalotaxi]SFH57910.1 pyridoxamine 5'-phosphate oxidase [Actinopolymorpha cephalotaxi]